MNTKRICVVLDLDRTLIDDDFVPYPNVKPFVDAILKASDFCILWTAGNKEHLFQFLQLQITYQ